MANEAMAPGFGSRTTDVAVQMLNEDGRKHNGNTASIGCAHPHAAVASGEIPIGRYKEPAREGIQPPRVTAHVFARLANRRVPDVSTLR